VSRLRHGVLVGGQPGARQRELPLGVQEDFVIVRRKGNPLGRKPTLAKYCAAPHLVVSASGDPHGIVDRHLAKRGLTRRVVLTVSNFSQAISIVAESDLVAAMPRLFAARQAPRFDVEISEPPFPLISDPIRAVVPEAATADAGLAWLLELLEKTARAVGRRR